MIPATKLIYDRYRQKIPLDWNKQKKKKKKKIVNENSKRLSKKTDFKKRISSSVKE